MLKNKISFKGCEKDSLGYNPYIHESEKISWSFSCITDDFKNLYQLSEKILERF